MSSEETILTYQDDGKTYEIDHLGINQAENWGTFAVYCGGDMIADFCIPESALAAQFRSSKLPPDEELIEHAKGAVRGEYASDEELAQYLETQGMIGRHLPSAN